MKWERVKVKLKARDQPDGKKSPGRKGGGAGPGKKWGHTCNSVKNGRFIYVFGGYGKNDSQTNDIHVFDTARETWTKPTVKGTPPSPRDSHSCTTVNSNLFVFGGTDGTNPLKDLHIFDTVTNTWSRPKTKGEGPAAREGHSAALIGQKLYVFGGCGRTADDPDETYFNDLYTLDTVTYVWTKVTTGGSPPAPRDSHTCSAWKNKFVVLGGEDASNCHLSDVHMLDTDTLQWKELRTTGQKLVPRAGHTSISLGKHLFVFGGFTDDRKLFDDLHVLSLDSGVWTKAVTTGVGPSPRFSLAGDTADPEKGILIFLGGCNETLEALDDMYYLETELKMEDAEDEPKPEKMSLKKELKRRRQGDAVAECEKGKEVCDIDDRSVLFVPAATASVGLPGGEVTSPCDARPGQERMFEAKVTDVFHYGYTLEATIDSKPVRGLLFCYKSGFSQAAHSHLTRRKLADVAAAEKLRELRKQERKAARALKLQTKRAEEQKAKLGSEAASVDQSAAVSPPAEYEQYLKLLMATPSSLPDAKAPEPVQQLQEEADAPQEELDQVKMEVDVSTVPS